MPKQSLETFLENVSALREFTLVTRSYLDDRFDKLINEHGGVALVRAAFKHQLDPDFAAGFKKSGQHSEALEESFKRVFEDVCKDYPEVSPSEILEHFDQVEGVLAIKKAGKSLVHLNRSSLVSLATAAECLVSSIAASAYRKFPGLLSSKSTLTLQELSEVGSVEEAREMLIERKVEELTRKSFEDWLSFFKEHLNLGDSFVTAHLDRLVEVFQRRNLIVHNSGRVNATYLSRVRCERKLKKGQVLSVSDEYLSDAIDLIENVFGLLALYVWKKWEPMDARRGKLLVDMSFDRLQAGHFSVALGYSHFLSLDRGMPAEQQMIGKVNFWIAQRELGKMDVSDFKELSEFDVSALNLRFQVAKHVLLDEYAASVPLIRDAVEKEDLELEDLQTWPLFKVFRERDDFKVLIAEFEAKAARDGEREVSSASEDKSEIETP